MYTYIYICIYKAVGFGNVLEKGPVSFVYILIVYECEGGLAFSLQSYEPRSAVKEVYGWSA